MDINKRFEEIIKTLREEEITKKLDSFEFAVSGNTQYSLYEDWLIFVSPTPTVYHPEENSKVSHFGFGVSGYNTKTGQCTPEFFVSVEDLSSSKEDSLEKIKQKVIKAIKKLEKKQ